MLIVRTLAGGEPAIGMLTSAGIDLLPAGTTLSSLLELSLDELREALQPTGERARQDLLAPVDGETEVWAAGVTYERSMAARQEESREPDVYTRVYSADRPELFFKAPAWRVVGTGAAVGIRHDSENNVPEAELALVVNRHGEIVGITAGNDMSSRSIEGENPLYLPQAKVYQHSCALGPGIRPVWEVTDLLDLNIGLSIVRDGVQVFGGAATTGSLHRRPQELVEYLFRATPFPYGVVLLTGTSIVPELDFTLMSGDVVRVSIDDVGTLENRVTVVGG